MPFPFSAHGKVVAESIDVVGAMSAVEAMLHRAKASRIALDDHRIEFTAGVFRLVTSWNLLGAMNSGTVAFRQLERGVEVRYRLSFMQMFVIVSVMVLFFFGVYPVMSMGPQARVPLPALAFAWFWIFGGNYVITIFRFPSAMRSALSHATRNA
jgi:hypothetical protein